MRLERCSVSEAMNKLENGSNFSFHRAEPIKLAHSTLQIQSVQPLQDKRLIDYLQSKRSIDIAIAREYCKEVYYTTNGKSFFAVGFQSDAGGWELRNEYFKGSSSPKSPTTIGNGSSTCLLFEGFMDMLSYLTLKNTIRPTVNMVVLNSVHIQQGDRVGSGELYSKEHSKRFRAKNASLKLEQDKAKPENIRFTINGTDIFDWFKQKQREFLHSIGINPSEQTNNRGLKR